ncbi:MAG: hypothetical protein ACR2FX_06095 [Chthoniobacterales bacterium]
MKFGFSEATNSLCGMLRARSDRLPYIVAALVIASRTFKPGQLLQLLGISSVAIGFAFATFSRILDSGEPR